MKKIAKRLVPNPGTLLILGLFLLAQSVTGSPPVPALTQAPSATLISYQGRLADAAGNPLTGDYQMQFALYDVPTGGSACWSETQTVSVSEGLFNVLLGSVNAIGSSCLTGDVYLGIKIGDDSEMTPRELLTSVPYAVQALTVPDGSVTAAKLNLVDGNVGIGTASPESKLHVVGGNVPLLVKGTWSVPANAVGIRLWNVNDEAVFDVWQDGKVNIQGNTTLGGDLTVGGVIQSTNNGAMYLKGGDDAALYDVDAANTIGIYGQQDSTQGHIQLGSNGPTVSGVSGNVGIGTASPSEKLHVNGNIKGSGNLTVGGNTGIGVTSPVSPLQLANNDSSGSIDDFGEYQILLFQGVHPNYSYGLGVEDNTLWFNSDRDFKFYRDGAAVDLKLSNGNATLGGDLTVSGGDLYLGSDGTYIRHTDQILRIRNAEPAGNVTIEDDLGVDGDVAVGGANGVTATRFNSPGGSDLSVDAVHGTHKTLTLHDDVRIPEGALKFKDNPGGGSGDYAQLM